ncbi:MAG TPA: DNA polymerase II large subunit [Methanosarcinales archaeon]|nr:DNA polymerase II large subunit [Methanosarcinales archaeon]
MTSDSTYSYFDSLESDLERAVTIASRARSRGRDPETHPEIPMAKDIADRVENLIEIPIAGRIRELAGSGMSREESALQLGADIATMRIHHFESRDDAVEAAIRAAVALLTEGVVAAPIEGIARVTIAKNDDGTEFVRIFYAGPVRSAGGTAQALSVLVADYVRRELGINRYIPRKEEIERYVEEITTYRRTANLQYMPTDDEIRLITSNCPICIDGEPTEEVEVDGYRDLDRVETNRVRGGMALVIAEGMALKAPKILKHVTKLGLDGWDFLNKLVTKGEKSDDGGTVIKPKDKYLNDLIAGRPVFSHPSMPGGFRLRYGRSRNTGFAAAGVSPATMVITDGFIAPGTQMRVERPGKAAGVAPVSGIEGPTVRLFGGEVLHINDEKQAVRLHDRVEKILDVGEILVNYGDFLENNHPLLPSPYCFEWWALELAEKVDPDTLDTINAESDLENPDQEFALELCDRYSVPLHPKFTYLWHDITVDDFKFLSEYVSSHGSVEDGILAILNCEEVKNILETILIPHRVADGRILIDEPLPLLRCLGTGDTKLGEKNDVTDNSDANADNADTDTDTDTDTKGMTVLDLVSAISGIRVMPRAPSRIGARMGRPEKSNKREMKPAPHVLFPVGDAGGKSRLLKQASNHTRSMNSGIGVIPVEIGMRRCKKCGSETYEYQCGCGGRTEPVMECPRCKIGCDGETCPKCGATATSAKGIDLDLKSRYASAFANLGERDTLQTFKGVQGLISKNKTPEPLEKGVLRAKHGVVVFKDGTVRYDLTDLPLTHFTPAEIRVDVETLQGIGYEYDIDSRPLTDKNQILQLRVQDIILSTDAAGYLLKVSRFIDDLLVKYYGEEPYYNASERNDLVGKLVIGLAPHTSAGVLGRIIGFTRASVGYAHPFFHAAKRRNCDGDEDCVMLLMDGLLNFSRSYLPAKRGGWMDAPLVLTTRLDPKEIDKEAHNIDIMDRYPLAFYEAAARFANPKDIEDLMDTVSKHLGTPAQYESMFTHPASNIASGPVNSAYKTLGSMVDKMEAQLALARKINAVDEDDVAERVINSHFLPDMIGNLRAFSRQRIRCVKCGAKFRRPLLSDVCPKCRGKIILTVTEGSVKKYLDTSTRVAAEYEVYEYTRQRIEMIGLEIKSLFESDKSRQMGLFEFM